MPPYLGSQTQKLTWNKAEVYLASPGLSEQRDLLRNVAKDLEPCTPGTHGRCLTAENITIARAATRDIVESINGRNQNRWFPLAG